LSCQAWLAGAKLLENQGKREKPRERPGPARQNAAPHEVGTRQDGTCSSFASVPSGLPGRENCPFRPCRSPGPGSCPRFGKDHPSQAGFLQGSPPESNVSRSEHGEESNGNILTNCKSCPSRGDIAAKTLEEEAPNGVQAEHQGNPSSSRRRGKPRMPQEQAEKQEIVGGLVKLHGVNGKRKRRLGVSR
jgi:hypothetical protein